MDPALVLAAAERFGAPLYLYDLDAAVARTRLLAGLFGSRFGISYAIKANPNAALMRALRPEIETFDASSFAEVRRALAAGMPAARVSFSGPAKRVEEIEAAVEAGVGELVLESLRDAEIAGARAVALGRRQPALVRINPLRVPRKFGASMAGGASQFGVDEEDIAEVLPRIRDTAGIALTGFHVYSGSNCLDAPAIAENFAIFAGIFRAAAAIAGIAPRRLIFGSGFGVPYLPEDTPLDHAALPPLVAPVVDALRAELAFAQASCALELGRWLVAPAGWLLTRVVAEKRSRGAHILACDAGFNNHLAACGMMGSVFRRNWRFRNVTRDVSGAGGEPTPYTLVGPLCTTIDRLGVDVPLPPTAVGDVVAVENSGAYGLTASPTRFISHPEPREIVHRGGRLEDATESLMNHWATPGRAA